MNFKSHLMPYMPMICDSNFSIEEKIAFINEAHNNFLSGFTPVEVPVHTNVKMSFKDAPVGARFKYPNSDKIWIKINSYPKGKFNDGNGLICSWKGNVNDYQEHCSFVDEEDGIDFDTEIVLI